MSKSKAVLEVSLDTTLNPPVVISNRNLKASGRKIRWKRKKGQTFTFERLGELDQAYFNNQSINMERTRIRCDNRAPDSGDSDKYEYVITVEWNGNEYTSTKSGAPGGDKPVIRN